MGSGGFGKSWNGERQVQFVAAEYGRVLVRASPIMAFDFDGFVSGLEIKVDCAVALNRYAVMDCGAGNASGLDDIVVVTQDVGEPEWRRNWESMIGGLLEDPTSELFRVDGNGGSIGEAGVGLTTGG